MFDFAIHNEIKNSLRAIYGTRKAAMETIQVQVDNEKFYTKLSNGLYFLINETLDIPTTATVVIEGQNNLLIASKDSFMRPLRAFRSYLSVKTINYGTEFVPFSLQFLKVMPYEQ